MSQIHFDNMIKQKALSHASTLSQKMMNITTDEEMLDILWKPYAFEDYDPVEIKKRLEYLRPDNCYMLLMSKGVEKEYGAEQLETEKWYGTKYKVTKLSDEDYNRLQQALNQSDNELKMGHPTANHFIPDELI